MHNSVAERSRSDPANWMTVSPHTRLPSSFGSAQDRSGSAAALARGIRSLNMNDNQRPCFKPVHWSITRKIR